MTRWTHFVGLALAVTLLPALAHSQARAPGVFEEQATRAANATDDTRLRLQTGASLATGNTQSFAANLVGRFLMRRGSSQLTVDAVVNYGRTSVQPAGASADTARIDTTTAENYLGRIRLDQFFSANNSIYLAAQGFRDQPSGFDGRLSGQVGYLRNIIATPGSRRVWGELGFDLTYENLTEPPSPGASDDRVLAFGRAYLGFEEHATTSLDLIAGVEALLNLGRPSDYRVNATLAAASKIGDDFSLALSVSLRYLSEPIGMREPLDTVTLVSVIYQRQFQTIPAPVH